MKFVRMGFLLSCIPYILVDGLRMASFVAKDLSKSKASIVKYLKHSNRLISSTSSTKRFIHTANENFLSQLGHPKYICGPMVDHSDLAFRMLTLRHGTDLAFSQMLNANTMLQSSKRFGESVDWERYDQYFKSIELIDEARRLDKNIIVQLAGDNPSTLAAVGKQLHRRVAAIDINLGCPQQIAKKGNYGSFLLPNIDLVCNILSTLVQELDCPITTKIRLFPDLDRTIRNCQRMADCGVSMLTVHGRTKESNKQLTGPADWDAIREIKKHVQIPVIANGGIQYRQDAFNCLAYTNADGVMAAEGLLENPKLFSEHGQKEFLDSFIECQLGITKEYLDILSDMTQNHVQLAEKNVKSHLFKLWYRFLQALGNHDLRQKLGVSRTVSDFQSLYHILHSRLQGLDEAAAIEKNLLVPIEQNWYCRHQSRRSKTKALTAEEEVGV